MTPLTAKELADLAESQRKEGKFEEALASALAATKANPDSAHAWWQVALSRLGLGDPRNAIPALERTLELSPQFGPGWAKLGDALLKTEDEEAAREAFERALEEEPNSINAMRGLADIYSKQHGAPDKATKEQRQKEIALLSKLENLAALSSLQRNRLGILYYLGGDYWMAQPYWRRDADDGSVASRFNLGLLYSLDRVSREADAIDTWRRTLAQSPDYEAPKKSLAIVLPGALERAAAARKFGPTLLPKKQWFRHYISPFRLLGPEAEADVDGLDAKAIQKLKKAVLREIEFEDGKIEWIDDLVIDRSRAISLIDELGDGTSNRFYEHAIVLYDRRLLDFLMTGAHEHFLVSEESPLNMIDLVEDGALEWISEPFARQFDLVLSEAISQKNLTVIECLMDGRRWVMPAHDDICFGNARHLISELLDPLRSVAKMSDTMKPSAEVIAAKMAKNKLDSILNLLPSYFWEIQDEVSSLLRVMARKAYEKHGDIDEAKKILELTQRIKFKGANEAQIIEDDFKQIADISQSERKYEVKLTSGEDAWNITKEGATCGAVFIPVNDVASVRWGVVITRQQNGSTKYDYEVTVTAADSRDASYTWYTTNEIVKSQKHFSNLVDAAIAYLLPVIMGKIETALAGGRSFGIGPCQLTSAGIQFETWSWLSLKQHSIPWERVGVDMVNGNLIVSDRDMPKTKISMRLKSTNNAHVLRILVLSRQQSKD